jgi:hypothetical protein
VREESMPEMRPLEALSLDALSAEEMRLKGMGLVELRTPFRCHQDPV